MHQELVSHASLKRQPNVHLMWVLLEYCCSYKKESFNNFRSWKQTLINIKYQKIIARESNLIYHQPFGIILDVTFHDIIVYDRFYYYIPPTNKRDAIGGYIENRRGKQLTLYMHIGIGLMYIYIEKRFMLHVSTICEPVARQILRNILCNVTYCEMFLMIIITHMDRFKH